MQSVEKRSRSRNLLGQRDLLRVLSFLACSALNRSFHHRIMSSALILSLLGRGMVRTATRGPVLRHYMFFQKDLHIPDGFQDRASHQDVADFLPSCSANTGHLLALSLFEKGATYSHVVEDSQIENFFSIWVHQVDSSTFMNPFHPSSVSVPLRLFCYGEVVALRPPRA